MSRKIMGVTVGTPTSIAKIERDLKIGEIYELADRANEVASLAIANSEMNQNQIESLNNDVSILWEHVDANEDKTTNIENKIPNLGNALIGEKSGNMVVVDDVSPNNKNLSVVSTIDPVQGDGVPSLDNPLHLGTRSSATLTVSNEAESKEFYIDFGQEIYSGTFDWSTGVLTIDRAKHIVDANDRWHEADTDSSYAGKDARKRYHLPVYNNKWMSDFIGVNSAIVDSKLSCSISPTVSSLDTWNNKEGISTIGDGIYFYFEQYATDFEGFKQAIIGAEIVYGLLNPITVQLTPQQIEALGEITTLSSDTGDTTVKYNRDINKAFAEIMQAIISLGGNV